MLTKWKSSIITEETMSKKSKRLDPIHPGEILSEDFMKPLGLSMNRLSRELHVSPTRIHGIVHGTRAISADTAIRLSVFFGTTPETWLNLQSDYDLRVASRTCGQKIANTVRPLQAA